MNHEFRTKIVESMTDAMFNDVHWSSFWSREEAKQLCEVALNAALKTVNEEN